MGDTAKTLSERFGKIAQEKESISINRMDTSVNRSVQLEYAVPASKISALSSGEFVGMVADDPNNKIKLKAFHSEIINDTQKLNRENRNFLEIPLKNTITSQEVQHNYYQIKVDIKKLLEKEVDNLQKG